MSVCLFVRHVPSRPRPCPRPPKKLHIQSSRSPVRPLLREAKSSYVYLILKKTWSEFQMSSQTTATRGEAELRILNFKTTWSEFQMSSQTTATRGEAELRILNFKTIWLEFQKPCQTAVLRGEAELRIYNLKKKHHLPRVGPKQLCASAHLGCTRAAGTS